MSNMTTFEDLAKWLRDTGYTTAVAHDSCVEVRFPEGDVLVLIRRGKIRLYPSGRMVNADPKVRARTLRVLRKCCLTAVGGNLDIN